MFNRRPPRQRLYPAEGLDHRPSRRRAHDEPQRSVWRSSPPSPPYSLILTNLGVSTRTRLPLRSTGTGTAATMAAWLHRLAARTVGQDILAGHGVLGGKAIIATLRWRLIAVAVG